MKNKILALCLVLLFCLSAFPVMAEEMVVFTDVPPEHKAHQAVNYLAEKGIVNGVSETEFAPENSLKREEFAKILANTFKLTSTQGALGFTDVPYGEWYSKPVALVSASGLMLGVSETQFGTGSSLSRQDLAVTLKRFADENDIKLSSGNTVLYADNQEISPYAVDAVASLSSAGVMTATQNNCFEPNAEATRADTAVAVYNLLSLQNEQKALTDQERLENIPAADWLIRNIYEPFDAANLDSEIIATEDFEDTDFGILREGWFVDGTTMETTGGYESNGCLKVKDIEFDSYLSWDTQSLNPGDSLILKGMVKSEGLTSRPTIGFTVYNADDNTWMTETRSSLDKWNTDWLEYEATVTIPTIPNKPRPSGYEIRLTISLLRNNGGTIWVDDFELKKSIYPPLETCLMSPNYKGLVYGEGGIGDIRLQAYVLEQNGAFDLDNMTYVAQITDHNDKVYMESRSEKVTPEMQVFFSSASLPMGGDYHLRSFLYDKTTGEEIDHQDWTIRKREADYRPEGYFDEHGRYIWRGEPELTMMMYSFGGGNDNYESAMECLQNSLGHEVNVHHEVGFGRWDEQFQTEVAGTKEWLEIFEKGKKGNVRFHSSMGNFYLSDAIRNAAIPRWSPEDLVATIYEVATYNKENFDVLSGYYIFDEVNATWFGDDYAFLTDVMAYADLDHFTHNAIDDLRSERPGVNSRTSDILMVDEYPLRGDEPYPLYRVYDRVKELSELNPGRPYGLIAQGFCWGDNGGYREPTQQEFRNMLFQGLCAGASMFEMYAYQHLKGESPDTWRSSYEGYMEVYDEIGRSLEPIILSVEPSPYYEIRGGGNWLNHMSRRHNGHSYLFAVNNRQEENTAKFYLDGATEMTGMYSGKTYQADDEGWVTVDFDELAVEVFMYEQPDYLSSHAELSYFSLLNQDGSGIFMTDSDAEHPSFKIPECKKEVQFAAVTSENAKLFINDQQVNTNGTIDITNKSAITVRVESEDGRFSTEKTYLLERYVVS